MEGRDTRRLTMRDAMKRMDFTEAINGKLAAPDGGVQCKGTAQRFLLCVGISEY
jgi:hypothetical protein